MARLDSDVPARDTLKSSVSMLPVPRYVLCRAGEDQPGIQSRLGCTRLVMAPQPPSTENGTLQSDMDIPGERDRRYGPPPPKCSDDNADDDDDDDDYSTATTYYILFQFSPPQRKSR